MRIHSISNAINAKNAVQQQPFVMLPLKQGFPYTPRYSIFERALWLLRCRIYPCSLFLRDYCVCCVVFKHNSFNTMFRYALLLSQYSVYWVQYFKCSDIIMQFSCLFSIFLKAGKKAFFVIVGIWVVKNQQKSTFSFYCLFI